LPDKIRIREKTEKWIRWEIYNLQYDAELYDQFRILILEGEDKIYRGEYTWHSKNPAPNTWFERDDLKPGVLYEAHGFATWDGIEYRCGIIRGYTKSTVDFKHKPMWFAEDNILKNPYAEEGLVNWTSSGVSVQEGGIRRRDEEAPYNHFRLGSTAYMKQTFKREDFTDSKWAIENLLARFFFKFDTSPEPLETQVRAYAKITYKYQELLTEEGTGTTSDHKTRITNIGETSITWEIFDLQYEAHLYDKFRFVIVNEDSGEYLGSWNVLPPDPPGEGEEPVYEVDLTHATLETDTRYTCYTYGTWNGIEYSAGSATGTTGGEDEGMGLPEVDKDIIILPINPSFFNTRETEEDWIKLEQVCYVDNTKELIEAEFEIRTVGITGYLRVDGFALYEGLFESEEDALRRGALSQTGVGINAHLAYDEWGINPDYIKRFPNKVVGSGYEWYDPETKKPLFWDTDGIVTEDANWEGTVALELAPGQTAKQSTLAEIGRPHVPAGADPEWWDNVRTRISFKHKGARVKAWVERYDTGEKLYIYDNSEQGNVNKYGQDSGIIREGYELEWGPIPNWALFTEVDRMNEKVPDMSYLTKGYASFYFIPEQGIGRVKVCFQNAEVEEELSGVRLPFWEVEEPPEEWGSTDFRPLKTIQGYNDYSNSRVSNWVPTGDGRFICSWPQDGAIVLGYTSSEEKFLNTGYPAEETITITDLDFGTLADCSMFKLEDGKLLLFVRHQIPDPGEEYGTMSERRDVAGSRIDCYISSSGNGYAMAGEDKVSDFVHHTLVRKNTPGWSDSQYPFLEVSWDKGMLNEPFRTDSGALLLSTCMAVGFKERGLVFRSTNDGETWTLTFHYGLTLLNAGYFGFCKPFQIGNGDIFVMMMQGSANKHMYRSTTDGQAFTETLGEWGQRFGYSMTDMQETPRFASFGCSFWYDKEQDRLYMHAAGTFTGCGIFILDEPNNNRIMSFAYHRWKHFQDGDEELNERSDWEQRFMYTHTNTGVYSRLYRTPKDRLAVQWSDLSTRTVIIGFGGPAGNAWLDAVQIEPDFTFKHPSFYTKGPRSLPPIEVIGMPGMGEPGTDPDTGEPILKPNKHAETHCIDGGDHVSPECIGAISKEEFLAMLDNCSYRQAYFNSDQWVVEHYMNTEPVITIWKGPIGEHGFGTQPFGTSIFGGGINPADLVEATHEPTIEVLDKDRFVVNWTSQESGIVVALSPEMAAGLSSELTASWEQITGKPSTFTPSEHGNEAHDPNFANEGHDHDLAYADIDHDHDDDYLNKANTAEYNPSGDYHPATKKYVDDNAGGGAFTELTDTPANYTGQAGKVATVNVGEDGLEFADGPAAANGLPAGGTAGQMLAKIDAADYNAEWVEPPSGGGGDTDVGLVKKLVALGM